MIYPLRGIDHLEFRLSLITTAAPADRMLATSRKLYNMSYPPYCSADQLTVSNIYVEYTTKRHRREFTFVII